MKILVVEDDKNLLDYLRTALEAELYTVDTASDGAEGAKLGTSNTYDVILIDNILPQKNGMQVCEEIRSSGKNTPIVMLSVLSDITRKVNVLNAGADDYITKPFSFQELSARLKAIMRRPQVIQSDILQVDDLVLKIKNHEIKRGDIEIYLTRKELLLLQYLMRNQGQVLSRSMIMENVWDNQGDIYSNTIETHILNLRKKIDLPGKTKLIHTIPGRGYKLDVKGKIPLNIVK